MADIIRRYGNQYIQKHSPEILPSHLKAMRHIAACRTPEMGGQKWLCPDCGKIHYSYHSCRNRHCPKCQNDRADQWIKKQLDLLLPVPYFMATITVPEGLRASFRSNQKSLYHLFFKASSEAIMLLAKDRRFLGAQIGMMGILQTWSRQLAYHPHIHFLIPGGGIRQKDNRWKYAKPDFLLHVKPLSKLIRRLFRQMIKQTGLYQKIDPSVWQKDWVCHVEPVGSGEAVLKYLAPYVYRVAISDKNILRSDDGRVTFRYRKSQNDTFCTTTMDALDFLSRFLQHVLPKGFVKVRYFGFLATKKRHHLVLIKEQVGQRLSIKSPDYPQTIKKSLNCQNCGKILIFVCEIPRYRGPP
jgi:hypothetical protein